MEKSKEYELRSLGTRYDIQVEIMKIKIDAMALCDDYNVIDRLVEEIQGNLLIMHGIALGLAEVRKEITKQ